MSTLAQPARQELRLEEALRYPFSEGWAGRAAFAGVMLLLPIVGPFVFAGWHHACFEAARRGEPMPSPEIGRDLSAGFRVVVAWMLTLIPIQLPMFAGMGVMLLGIPQGNEEPGPLFFVGVLVVLLTSIPVVLLSIVFMPEITRRIYRGAWFPWGSIGDMFRAIRARPKDYLMLIVVQMLAGFVGSLGVYACYVGAIFTLPIGNAMQSHALAQWDELVGD